jgi:hypothetical protein
MSLKTNIVSGLAAVIYAWSAMLGAQDFSAAQVTTVAVADGFIKPDRWVALVYDVIVANQ